MKYTKAIVIASVAAASIAMLGNAPTAGGEAEIGKAAPTFSLTDSNGKAVNLEDFKGKVVVLEWTNDGCPIVKRHYKSKNMQDLQKKYTKEGVVWLSIISSAPGKQGHVDGDKANELTKSRKASPSYVLFDPTGKVGHQYDAKTTPHMFVIDKKGVLRYDGGIDDDTRGRGVDVKPYAAWAIDAVLAGKEVKVKTSKPYGCAVKY